MIPAGEWREHALCAYVDPELWFPEKGDPLNTAIGVCQRCPVQLQCLNYALISGQQYGVWGGYTARQLRRLRRATEEMAA